MRRRGPRREGRRWLRRGVQVLGAVLAVLLALTAAGFVWAATDDGPTLVSRLDIRREPRIAADPSASADDIIGVGSATTAVTDGTFTLVGWTVTPNDDEGATQAAWRLYDADGERIADGTLGIIEESGASPFLYVVPDGFLMASYVDGSLHHISRQGRVTDVPFRERRTPTRAGDVLITLVEGEGDGFYRPADHAAYNLPRLPFANPQRISLDARGTVWVLEEWTRRSAGVSASAGGVGPWRRSEIPLSRSSAPMTLGVVGGRVVVPVADDVPGQDSPVLQSLWTRPVTPAGGARWTRFPARDERLPDTLDPDLAALDGDRIVLSGGERSAYVERADAPGRFDRVAPPRGADDAYVEVSDSTLFLVFSRDHRLYRSDDGGRSWKTSPR